MKVKLPLTPEAEAFEARRLHLSLEPSVGRSRTAGRLSANPSSVSGGTVGLSLPAPAALSGPSELHRGICCHGFCSPSIPSPQEEL